MIYLAGNWWYMEMWIDTMWWSFFILYGEVDDAIQYREADGAVWTSRIGLYGEVNGAVQKSGWWFMEKWNGFILRSEWYRTIWRSRIVLYWEVNVAVCMYVKYMKTKNNSMWRSEWYYMEKQNGSARKNRMVLSGEGNMQCDIEKWMDAIWRSGLVPLCYIEKWLVLFRVMERCCIEKWVMLYKVVWCQKLSVASVPAYISPQKVSHRTGDH
jgi:hypothetical protein